MSENAVDIPEEVEFWAEHYGERYGVKPEIIEAVCWVESRCTQDAQNADKTCKGIMQIKVNSHKSRMDKCNVQNIFGLRENIKVGTDYLAELGVNDETEGALAAYNGTTNRESKYVKTVIATADALETIHKK